MSPAMWVTLALCLEVAVGFYLGSRVARDTDTFTISALRDALASAQMELTEAWFAKAESVAAQEQAESALKAAFERKSEAGKRAWQTRKANAA